MCIFVEGVVFTQIPIWSFITISFLLERMLKFLGMLLYSKLTFVAHLKSLKKKCVKFLIYKVSEPAWWSYYPIGYYVLVSALNTSFCNLFF